MSRIHAIPAPSGAARLQIATRVVTAVLGGYGFGWGVAAALTSLLFAAGMEFHDAEFLGMAAGLLGYLAAFLWTFAARRLGLAWLVLVGGGALLAAAGSFVQSLLD